MSLTYACAPVYSDFTDSQPIGERNIEIGTSYSETALYADTLNRFATLTDYRRNHLLKKP